jgi:hypothetical protein
VRSRSILSTDIPLRLIYWGIGNPNPVHPGAGRKGDNSGTCSIVALNVDTGELVWGYQASPRDPPGRHFGTLPSQPIGQTARSPMNSTANGTWLWERVTHCLHSFLAPAIEARQSDLPCNEVDWPIPIPVTFFYPGVLTPLLSISMAFSSLLNRVSSCLASVIQRQYSLRWV